MNSNIGNPGIFQRLKIWAKALKTEIIALYYAYKHPRVSLAAKIFTACVVAYALSPIDLIPDFIPLLGYLDDIIILPLGIAAAVKMIPADIMLESREKAKMLIQRPRNWVAGVFIIVIWVLLALWLFKYFIRHLS